MDLFERVDFDQTVLTIDGDGEIVRHTLRELALEHADTTTTPEGVKPRMHIRNATQLWTWGAGGNNPSLVYEFQTAEEAEHGLLLCHRQDLLSLGGDRPTVYSTQGRLLKS